MTGPMHPWFAPLHRRVLTLAVCLAWAAFEAWQDTRSVWFWLALGFAAYAATLLFQRPAPDDAGPTR